MARSALWITSIEHMERHNHSFPSAALLFSVFEHRVRVCGYDACFSIIARLSLDSVCALRTLRGVFNNMWTLNSWAVVNTGTESISSAFTYFLRANIIHNNYFHFILLDSRVRLCSCSAFILRVIRSLVEPQINAYQINRNECKQGTHVSYSHSHVASNTLPLVPFTCLCEFLYLFSIVFVVVRCTPPSISCGNHNNKLEWPIFGTEHGCVVDCINCVRVLGCDATILSLLSFPARFYCVCAARTSFYHIFRFCFLPCSVA